MANLSAGTSFSILGKIGMSVKPMRIEKETC